MPRLTPTHPFIPFPIEAVEGSIPARFEHIVQRYPQHLAVKTRTQSLTYEALNRLANRVAHAILAQRGPAAEPLAILLETGALAVAASVGALKAGKFYTMLDLDFPEDRLTAILADVQPGVLLTTSPHLPLAHTLTAGTCAVLNLDTLDADLPMANPRLVLTPESLSEITYTSGSTGRPKGVLQTHRTTLHEIRRLTNAIHLSAMDRLTLFASLNTGQGRGVLYRTLLNGATLYPWQIKQEGVTQVAAWLHQEAITIYYSSATLFRAFVATLTGHEHFPHLRLIRVGGESVTPQDVALYKAHFPPSCLFLNALSSTEIMTTRLYLMDHETPIGSTVPVGYAIEDMETLLLDEQGHAVGVNQPGEIAIKSRYLSPGYWRQPGLTAATFLPDPAGGEARVYYTGDLGIMGPDGCLVHLGRKDTQVKIRGYRVEVAEIERVLCTHDAIQAAVVLARPDPAGEPCLVAYIVPTQCPAPALSVLRDLLRQRLPDYMMPAAFVWLEALPLTPSGKVDRQRLPAPARTRPLLDQPYVAPRTPIETEIAGIWGDVLGLDQVGIEDPFLALGGDSLRAARIITRVLGILHVTVSQREMLEAATIAHMAERVMQSLVSGVTEEDLLHLLEEVDG